MGAGTLVQNIRRIVTRFHMGTESGTGWRRFARTTYAEPSPGVLNAASPKTAAHRKQQPFPEQRSPSTAMVLTSGDGSPCEARNNRPREGAHETWPRFNIHKIHLEISFGME